MVKSIEYIVHSGSQLNLWFVCRAGMGRRGGAVGKVMLQTILVSSREAVGVRDWPHRKCPVWCPAYSRARSVPKGKKTIMMNTFPVLAYFLGIHVLVCFKGDIEKQVTNGGYENLGSQEVVSDSKELNVIRLPKNGLILKSLSVICKHL